MPAAGAERMFVVLAQPDGISGPCDQEVPRAALSVLLFSRWDGGRVGPGPGDAAADTSCR